MDSIVFCDNSIRTESNTYEFGYGVVIKGGSNFKLHLIECFFPLCTLLRFWKDDCHVLHLATPE